MTKFCRASWANGRCQDKVFSSELCSGHHQQKRRGVAFSPLRAFRPKDVKTPEQFSRWAQTILVSGDGDCRLWPRGIKYGNPGQKISGVGYPYANVQGKQYGVHRLTAQFFLNHGEELSSGEVVHHRCSNKKCLNPEHLQITSPQANTAEWLDRKSCLARVSYLEKLLLDNNIEFE